MRCHKNVIYRQNQTIKPENVLINPTALEIKLIEYGCAETYTVGCFWILLPFLSRERQTNIACKASVLNCFMVKDGQTPIN